MSKLKTLKEARAKVFAQIDELRTATDGYRVLQQKAVYGAVCRRRATAAGVTMPLQARL